MFVRSSGFHIVDFTFKVCTLQLIASPEFRESMIILSQSGNEFLLNSIYHSSNFIDFLSLLQLCVNASFEWADFVSRFRGSTQFFISPQDIGHELKL